MKKISKEFSDWFSKRFGKCNIFLIVFLVLVSVTSVFFFYYYHINSLNIFREDIQLSNELRQRRGVENSGVEDLVIEFLDTPRLVDKKFDLFEPFKYSDEEGEVDPDNEYFNTVFMTGIVKSGGIKGNDLTGYTSYLLDDTVRILHHDQKNITYILTELAPPVYVFEEYSPNVFEVDIADPIWLFTESIFTPEAIVESDNGHKYVVLHGCEYIPEDALTIIDKVKDYNIYEITANDESLMYVRNKDGTYSALRYILPFEHHSENYEGYIISFKTNSDYDFTGSYSARLFNCNTGYTISHKSLSAFEQVGTLSNGEIIYQDKSKDRFEDVYEVYVDTSTNIGNSIQEDDEVPYTFERFLENYPIIYWQSPFGHFIEFQRWDFLPARGCSNIPVFRS